MFKKIKEYIINWLFEDIKLKVGSLEINEPHTLYTDTIQEKTTDAGIKLNSKVLDSVGSSFQKHTNLLDNGGFEIWQRGAGPFTSDADYTADRWYIELLGSDTISVEKETTEILNTSNASLEYTHTFVDGSAAITQDIESPKSYRGKELSFSVWVKTSSNTIMARINDDINQPSFSDYHSGSGSWEKLTVTHTVHTNATSIKISLISIGATATATYYIDDAMLVLGAVPSDFIPTPPAEEWERCHRFFEKGFMSGSGLDMSNTLGSDVSFGGGLGSEGNVTIHFMSIKPSAPTITISNARGYFYGPNNAAPQVRNISNSGFTWGINSDRTQDRGWVGEADWEAEVI